MTNEDKLRAVLKDYMRKQLGVEIILQKNPPTNAILQKYYNERQKNVDHALTQIKQIVVESLGEAEKPEWDSESWFCNRCDWQPTDGSKTCLCKVRNALRKELRSKWQ